MATKIPGALPPEPNNRLLGPEYGIGSNGGPAPGPRFAREQIPTGGEDQVVETKRHPVELDDLAIGKDGQRPKSLKGL